ncbi:Glutaconate CoA-transferase [Desulforamulus reducens MI-1]|uniref:Glutaconate CoA-transferase n=1 Tax=Desulforamulus reducens (strain ATCC BAA-1160 / DSM 100696 / MI-1) TaxID=349161 RepID=A4J5R0_DESRM|nr:CoA-transferase [Desulforamulus reducens]ABO50413.1 Glutaconate CoA-transferase [Desulforamulus reducens MI-1]
MINYAKDYTLPELMTAAAAREIQDGELAFIGVGMPLMAATVAKFTHAPNFNMMVEYGAVGPSPRRLPMCVNCAVNNERAYYTGNQREVMGAQQAGFVDVACISGAQIDKFGNLNSTFIGTDYYNPKVRLAGSGGANDLASSANRILIMMRQDGRNFVEKLDYLTSPGYLDGRPGAREQAGLCGGGPVAVITTMGVYRFDVDTREMYLEKIHPGVKLENIKAAVKWDLAISPNLSETELPTEEQVMIMRTLDPLAVYLGNGRSLLAGDFETFMNMFEDSYKPMLKLMKEKGM